MRLSRDDEREGESMSIEHQRIILKNFVKERGGNIVEEYIDDGFSGTSFDRPAIKRLLADAQSGKINTIVVKDLSRFGRNYIQVGQYVDYIFPAYGVRFIAISDNVDTAERGSTAMDMMPIMNVFNEWHAANTSKKIRAVLEASQRSGKYTSSIYPYGYKACADENRTAVIDGEAAAVVRRIFDLRTQGNSTRSIARILTDDGIPNPATYFTRIDGKKADGKFSPYWCPTTVSRILSNPVYLGKTVQHKTTSVSYKNHKTVKIPENERIVRENSHEAIISRETWEKVRDIEKSVSRGKTDKSQTVHALSGLLVCADCGKKMKLKTSGGKACFVCRTYTDLGKKYCTSHLISEAELESVALRDIRSMLAPAEIDGEKLKERYLKKKSAGEKGLAERLKALQSRLAELDKLIRSAFEEKVLNGMPESVCASLCESYIREKKKTEEDITEILKKLEEENGDNSADEYVRLVKEYASCNTLTREMCLQLINFITVGEREIKIYYRLR